MKFACLIVTLFFVIHLNETASNYEDLKARLTRDPQLRRELMKSFARSTGKLLLSDKIEMRGSVINTIQNTMNQRPFGLEYSLEETVELGLLLLKEAPEPDVITTHNYSYTNGGLNILATVLRLLKKALMKSERVDENDLSLVVNTTEGRLRGIEMEDSGLKYVGYFNIPYATLPKRFLAPKPPKPWKGIRNAIREERFCPQRMYVLNHVAGVEDCLQLNVHVPKPLTTNRPVLVWVHGGGFNTGITSIQYFNPNKLLKQGMIVVSFHYRLGALGFLSTGTKDAPGNAGMKDMVAALKWIKANIKNFGGDPNSITLYGVSSGAVAVEYLTISPMTRGLFDKAILSSGSVFIDWGFSTDPVQYAYRLGRELGYNATNSKNLVRFLRKVNPLQLVEAQEKMSENVLPSGDFVPFVPCAETNIAGVERFINVHPEKIIKSGNYKQLPLIVTFNDMEGLQIVSKIQSKHDSIQSIDKNLKYYLPRDILEGLKEINKYKILNKIRQFYFRGEKLNNGSVESLISFMGDVKFLLGVNKSVKLRTETSSMPIFYGEFAYDGDLSTFKYHYNVGIKGVAHADDLGYVFTLPYEKVYTDHNVTSQLVSKRLVKMFTDFAKYGHPVPKRTALLPVNWYPIKSKATYDYLRITDKLEMRQNPFQKRYKFWDDLYAYKKKLFISQ